MAYRWLEIQRKWHRRLQRTKENLCAALGHDWKEQEIGIRDCERCCKHEMLYENRYPDIGEAKYEWK